MIPESIFVIAYASLTISLSLASFSSPARPVITNSGGSFIMQFSIGNPPKPTDGYFDTASDLIYTQCRALRGSKTNNPIQCKTNAQCDPHLPGLTSCDPRTKTCDYETTNADGSGSAGGLFKDYITLPSSDGQSRSVSINMVLGCEPKLNGPGSVGLGRGQSSLVRQLNQSRFSYCLTSVSRNPTSSRLNFGEHAVVRGGLSTPLITTGGISSSFYYVRLSGISVGGDDERLPYNGNMILGTGTTTSRFPEPFYSALKSAVQKHVRLGLPFKDKNLPGAECFEVTSNTKFPEITVHLEGGADLKLDSENMFARMSKDEVCLAAAKASGEAIYGSLAMINFLVGIDVGAQQVKFLKTNCTKQP